MKPYKLYRQFKMRHIIYALFCLIIFILILHASMNTSAQVIRVDNQLQQVFYSGLSGNDVFVYQPTNKRLMVFDGGKGIDVLMLRLAKTKVSRKDLITDFIRFYYQVRIPGSSYQFFSLPIKVKNVEFVVIAD